MNRIFKIGRRRPGIVDLYAPLTQGLDQFGYRVKWGQNFDATFSAIINSTNAGFLDPNVNRMKVDTQPTTGTDVRIVFNPSSYGVALSGTFNVSASATVTPSMSQVGVVYPGSTLVFASQPGTSYTVLSVTSAPSIVLTTAYTGTPNAATSATLAISDTSSFWLQYAQVTGASETLVSAPTLILPDSANKGQGIVTIHGTAPSATSSAGALQLDFPFLMQNFQFHSEDLTNFLYVSTEQNGPETQMGPATFSQYGSTIYASQGSLWVRGANQAGSTGAAVIFSATATLSFPR